LLHRLCEVFVDTRCKDTDDKDNIVIGTEAFSTELMHAFFSEFDVDLLFFYRPMTFGGRHRFFQSYIIQMLLISMVWSLMELEEHWQL